MQDYPKRVKAMLRELAGAAYAEEMKIELGKLAESFDAWRAGEIDVWELERRIHKFHNVTDRDLYKMYNQSHVDMLVAYAIVRGVLSEESVSAEILSYLERPLTFYRHIEERSQAESQAKEPDAAEG